MWKVWYDDREPFTSSDGPPELAPKRGVQCIVIGDPDHGWTMARGNDFYIWGHFDGKEGWQGADQFGLWDYLQSPGYKLVLFGRIIGNVEYRQLLNRASQDMSLPVKTAWHFGERN